MLVTLSHVVKTTLTAPVDVGYLLVYWTGCRLDSETIVVWFMAGRRDFSFLQNIWTGRRVHPASPI